MQIWSYFKSIHYHVKCSFNEKYVRQLRCVRIVISVLKFCLSVDRFAEQLNKHWTFYPKCWVTHKFAYSNIHITSFQNINGKTLLTFSGFLVAWRFGPLVVTKYVISVAWIERLFWYLDWKTWDCFVEIYSNLAFDSVPK